MGTAGFRFQASVSREGEGFKLAQPISLFVRDMRGWNNQQQTLFIVLVVRRISSKNAHLRPLNPKPHIYVGLRVQGFLSQGSSAAKRANQ